MNSKIFTTRLNQLAYSKAFKEIIIRYNFNSGLNYLKKHVEKPGFNFSKVIV